MRWRSVVFVLAAAVMVVAAIPVAPGLATSARHSDTLILPSHGRGEPPSARCSYSGTSLLARAEWGRALSAEAKLAAGSPGGVAGPFGGVRDSLGAEDHAWAGYVASGRSFSSVSASWVQPAIQIGSTKIASQTAFWVGLDGFGDSTVEQTGTLAYSVDGKAS